MEVQPHPRIGMHYFQCHWNEISIPKFTSPLSSLLSVTPAVLIQGRRSWVGNFLLWIFEKSAIVHPFLLLIRIHFDLALPLCTSSLRPCNNQHKSYLKHENPIRKSWEEKTLHNYPALQESNSCIIYHRGVTGVFVVLAWCHINIEMNNCNSPAKWT